MPKGKKPLKKLNSIQKRDALASRKLSKEVLIGYGDDFLEREMVYDAMEFYKAAEHLEGLEMVKLKAIELGNAGALSWLEGYRITAIDEADWRATAENAERADKYAYVELAFRRAGDEEKANSLREQNTPNQPPPEEKRE